MQAWCGRGPSMMWKGALMTVRQPWTQTLNSWSLAVVFTPCGNNQKVKFDSISPFPAFNLRGYWSQTEFPTSRGGDMFVLSTIRALVCGRYPCLWSMPPGSNHCPRRWSGPRFWKTNIRETACSLWCASSCNKNNCLASVGQGPRGG